MRTEIFVTAGKRIAGILLHQTGVDCAPALKLGPT
jgi:hypothetical protein